MKAILILLSLAVAAIPVLAESDAVEVVHAVEFGSAGGRPLHAEIARPRVRPSEPMPAVLWIHGGGWKSGDEKGNPAAFLAAHGYFTASIEYRLSGEAIWPAQIEDCKQAVRWLRANAAAYGVDPDRIGVWGHSAGGHLVACLGTMGPEAGFEGEGYPGVSSKVQAVADFSGPADFLVSGRKAYDWALKPLFGGPAGETDEALRKASPLYYVQPGDPPFLIVHGDADTTVPYAESVALSAALEKAQVPVQFLPVKGGSHSMNAIPGGPPADPDQATIRAAVLAFFDRTLRAPRP